MVKRRDSAADDAERGKAVAPKQNDLRMTVFVSFAVLAFAAATLGAADQRPSWVPADATAVAPCVEALGDIYWDPKKLPFGPTYGVHDGKPVFEEIMVAQRDFEKGFNLEDVARPVPPFHVDHVDIWFAPHGHDGFTAPHYDILLVFMRHAEHMHLCGDSSGRPPDFVASKRAL